MLSICRELSSDHLQRNVVDGAGSEGIPIISGVIRGNVLGPLLFILYTGEMFQLVENRLHANADDSTLLQLSASQNTDLLLPQITGTWLGFRVVQSLVHDPESQQN